jgi:hypothetical protein
MTKERLLAALDKPRKAYALLMIVNPGGSPCKLPIST